MRAAKLLDRLERVKQSGPGRWLAKCPAHQDRSPSLSIRELDDGRVLLYDFAGCETSAILDALGPRMSALFPERIGHHVALSHSRIPARDLLAILSEEVSVVAIIAADLLERRTITETNWSRLATAAHRIHRARDHIHAG